MNWQRLPATLRQALQAEDARTLRRLLSLFRRAAWGCQQEGGPAIVQNRRKRDLPAIVQAHPSQWEPLHGGRRIKLSILFQAMNSTPARDRGPDVRDDA